MSFVQFLSYQALAFLLFFFAAVLTGGGEGIAANIVMNFLTFFTLAWVVTITRAKQGQTLAEVLTVSLSFNTVTYLFAYGLRSPLPRWQSIVMDFVLITMISLLGYWAAQKKQQHRTRS